MIPLTPDILTQKIPKLDSIEPCFDAGTFKWVYAAKVQNRKEALKVIVLPEGKGDDHEAEEAFLQEQVARIRREIEALAQCRVPEIVKLGAIAPVEFEESGHHYIAYSEEFIEGDNLWRLIRAVGPRPTLPELIRLFRTLLRCIEVIWGHGYVHRDIKPQNVMKTASSSRPFVLLDFGIAYAVYEVGLTYRPDQRVQCTPRYMAPEMMEPDFRDRLDYRADLYTTGMTVYEYAAGQHPLARDSDDMIRTISRVLRQPPKPLQDHRTDLPLAFCHLINNLLKKKPALRPANLKLIHRQLEGLT
jgi:serine/threonine-protein kinase